MTDYLGNEISVNDVVVFLNEVRVVILVHFQTARFLRIKKDVKKLV